MSNQSAARIEIPGPEIQYYPEYARAMGSVDGGVFLAFLAENESKLGEWFYVTDDEFADATCLPKRKVAALRKRAVALGLIETAFLTCGEDIRPRTHYRILFEIVNPNNSGEEVQA